MRDKALHAAERNLGTSQIEGEATMNIKATPDSASPRMLLSGLQVKVPPVFVNVVDHPTGNYRTDPSDTKQISDGAKVVTYRDPKSGERFLAISVGETPLKIDLKYSSLFFRNGSGDWETVEYDRSFSMKDIGQVVYTSAVFINIDTLRTIVGRDTSEIDCVLISSTEGPETWPDNPKSWLGRIELKGIPLDAKERDVVRWSAFNNDEVLSFADSEVRSLTVEEADQLREELTRSADAEGNGE